MIILYIILSAVFPKSLKTVDSTFYKNKGVDLSLAAHLTFDSQPKSR